MSVGDRPLSGRRVVTTREEPGRLDAALAALGADVIHVPLIEIADPADGGEALAAALARIDRYAWMVVTSQHGARRIATAAALAPGVRLAAVGTKTAAVLRAATGRVVDVVPARHTAADLVAAMPDPTPGDRVLAALADRAAPTLVAGLSERGYGVDAVVAYQTRLRRPSDVELAALRSADAVAFASGSAAEAWATACGGWTPRHVIAIGPTTAAAAEACGLVVTAVAHDHTVDGLVTAVAEAFG